MLIDADEKEFAPGGESFDIVIVGAGTVGLLMARILASHGRRIAIIESGGRVSVARADGGGVSVQERPHQGVTMGRAFGLGGTSVLWGGQLVEFSESDLTRPEHPWPISHAELKVFYRKTYEIFGLNSQFEDDDFRRDLAIPGCADDAVEHFFTRWLHQPNFAVLFRDMLTKDSNVSVFLNLTACDARFEGEHARSLLARNSRGEEITFFAKHFIFAAGTLGNAQFFLSTRHREVPWRANEHVGRYFHDHLGGTAGSVKVLDDKRFRRLFENGVSNKVKLQPKLRYTPLSRARGRTGVCGFFIFRSDLSQQIAQFKGLLRSFRSGIRYASLASLPLEIWRVGGTLAPVALRYIKDRRVLALYDQGIDFVFQAEQWPLYASAVLPSGTETMPNGLLPVSLDWHVDGRELESVREFVEASRQLLLAQGIADVQIDSATFATSENFAAHVQDTYHQAGGLRMSAAPDLGVTDAMGTVWGCSNVHVAGASTMPTSSYANCTLTALALALRLAEHLHRTMDAP